MLKVGITGQAGFIGTHFYNVLGLYPRAYERVPFEDDYFYNTAQLASFVRNCDVIVHLAAVNRAPDPQSLYETNIDLAKRLICALEEERVTPHILFSSSTQEERDNEYGKSKREGRELFEAWAHKNNSSFTGMVLPNVFGPFGRPNYNSFIATFCHKLTHDGVPEVLQDTSVSLIYIGSLINVILERISEVHKVGKPVVERVNIRPDFEKKVTEILSLFEQFKVIYFDQGYIPRLVDRQEINLFNTFRSYIDLKKHFPVRLTKHADARGVFVETLRLGMGGQVSFSTTLPGITRGNHYHTRKIERFTVIKGKARIQLRRIGSEEVMEFYLDGNEPAYVDMPVWYSHNITNVGEEELYTQFWINEWYDPSDGDTYFETV